MHDLREKLGLMRLEMGDVDTLNGYIVQQLGRWPRVGTWWIWGITERRS